jgi:hypothetical protein
LGHHPKIFYELDPNTAETWIHKGRVLEAMGQKDEAKAGLRPSQDGADVLFRLREPMISL